MSSIPGSGRSPAAGTGNPLQYSCLENPMDRGAWWAIVHGVAESDMTEHARTDKLAEFSEPQLPYLLDDMRPQECVLRPQQAFVVLLELLADWLHQLAPSGYSGPSSPPARGLPSLQHPPLSCSQHTSLPGLPPPSDRLERGLVCFHIPDKKAQEMPVGALEPGLFHSGAG